MLAVDGLKVLLATTPGPVKVPPNGEAELDSENAGLVLQILVSPFHVTTGWAFTVIVFITVEEHPFSLFSP